MHIPCISGRAVDNEDTFRAQEFNRKRVTRRLIWLTIFVQACAFVLELLPAISTPVVRAFYIAKIHAKTQAGQPVTSVASELRAGVWGFCAYSALHPATAFGGNAAECIGPQLGYTLQASVIEIVTDQVSLVDAVLQGVTVILVLHPVVAILSAITLLFAIRLDDHAWSIICLISGIITGIVAAISFAADLAIALVARSKVPTLTDGDFTVEIGNVLWMMLAALILNWLAVVFVSIRACVCWGIGRKHYGKHHHHHD